MCVIGAMRSGLFTVVVWLAVCAGMPAEEVPPGKDPSLAGLEARVHQFLEGISLGQAQMAYQELLAGSQLLKQTEALKSLVEKTKELEEKYGPYRALESIAAKRVGSDVVVLKYLYKCQRFPVVWHFTFYRSSPASEVPPEKEDWRVIIVRFDTEIESQAQ